MTREYISTTPISERSDRVQRKIQHHLNCLKRGKMTLWLKHRMTWDAEVCSAVAEILMPAPRPPTIDTYINFYGNLQVANPRSSVRITGLSTP